MPEILSTPSAGGSAPSGAPSGTPSAPAKVTAPLGAEPVHPSSPGAPSALDAQPTSSEPTLLSDDTLVRDGSGKVLKYGELYKRMQGDYTRKQQALARERETWQAEATRQREHNERVAAELLNRSSGQGQPGQDKAAQFLGELSKLPQISGQHMASILQTIRDEGFGAITQAISDRDTVMTALYNKIQALEKHVGVANQDRAQAELDTKIDSYLKAQNLDASWRDIAMDTYLAHEGADLDEQFPEILATRVSALQGAWKKQEADRVAAARNSRFSALPGKGGSAAPGKPLQLTGRESARQQADLIWDTLQAADGMTT